MNNKERAEKSGVSESAYKKYLEKYDPESPVNVKLARQKKTKAWKDWWAKNWIAFTAMMISLIALIVALVK